MLRPVALPLSECTQPAVAGAKAAWLARAAAAGFPVPGSLVVPCAVSEPVLAAALRQASTAGVHHSRLEVMAAGRSRLAGLEREAERLGPALAVRSSSPAEDDPRLAGAFSSLIGVPPADVVTAALSVWASAIQRRPEDAGRSGWPACPPRMAVLIQPEVKPGLAGTAEARHDGSVQVVATDGPAAPLMQGWAAGVTVEVPAAGAPPPVPPGAAWDRGVLLAAARLAREAAAVLGGSLVEWAWGDGRLWLLQVRPARPPGTPYSCGPGGAGAAGAGPPLAARPAAACTVSGPGQARRAAPSRRGPVAGRPPGVAGLLRAACLAGQLGERWLLPWAIALPREAEIGPGEPCREPCPEQLWRTFAEIADELTAQVWGVTPAAAGELAGKLAHGLKSGTVPAQGWGARASMPGLARAAQAISLLRRLAAHLASRGVICSAREVCALPADPVPMLHGEQGADARRRAYLAALSWEPALFEAVMSAGQRLAGVPVASGTGCGPCLRAEEMAVPGGTGSALPRPVVVAAFPLPRYAPLLIGAAGLVTRGGSGAAHLAGVARSLGVPAVTGCELPPGMRVPADVAPGLYAAVDGYAGAVSVLAR